MLKKKWNEKKRKEKNQREKGNRKKDLTELPYEGDHFLEPIFIPSSREIRSDCIAIKLYHIHTYMCNSFLYINNKTMAFFVFHNFYLSDAATNVQRIRKGWKEKTKVHLVWRYFMIDITFQYRFIENELGIRRSHVNWDETNSV